MQSLRIALALLGLVFAWFLLLPAKPTLLNPSSAVVVSEAADEPNMQAAVADEPEVQVDEAEPGIDVARPEANETIRSIIPSPLTAGGDLKRMPSVTSGAASPIEREPAAPPDETAPTSAAGPAQPAEAGDIAEPKQEASLAEASSDGNRPSFQMFNRPIAIDSGTIRAGETTLRVAGIEPIAPEARCANGEQSWPCGVRARTAFRAWLRGRSLLCTVPADGGDSRDFTAPCLLGEEDVGAWLVSNGWAAASDGSRYKDAETEARNARRGIWAFDIAG